MDDFEMVKAAVLKLIQEQATVVECMNLQARASEMLLRRIEALEANARMKQQQGPRNALEPV